MGGSQSPRPSYTMHRDGCPYCAGYSGGCNWGSFTTWRSPAFATEHAYHWTAPTCPGCHQLQKNAPSLDPMLVTHLPRAKVGNMGGTHHRHCQVTAPGPHLPRAKVGIVGGTHHCHHQVTAPAAVAALMAAIMGAAMEAAAKAVAVCIVAAASILAAATAKARVACRLAAQRAPVYI